MDGEIRRVPDRTSVATKRPKDHPILTQDARVLELALVSVSEGAVGGLRQACVGPDGKQTEVS